MVRVSIAFALLALACASPPATPQEPMIWVPHENRVSYQQARATCDAHFPLLGAVGASNHQLAMLLIQRRSCMNGYGWYLVPESEARAGRKSQ